MVAADALDGDHRAVAQRGDGCRDGGICAGQSVTGRISHDTCGPHAGQAFGWAWKRRSPGSSYSRWHAAHITNPAIVVDGRSYGTDRTIV